MFLTRSPFAFVKRKTGTSPCLFVSHISNLINNIIMDIVELEPL